jgi:hypothetical protein
LVDKVCGHGNIFMSPDNHNNNQLRMEIACGGAIDMTATLHPLPPPALPPPALPPLALPPLASSTPSMYANPNPSEGGSLLS